MNTKTYNLKRSQVVLLSDRSITGRVFSAGLVCLALSAFLVSSTGPASAFKLFGLSFFEPEAKEEVAAVDPVRYLVDLQILGVQSGDEELRKKLEEASGLVSRGDKPASGAIGLIGLAEGDFERLIAVLYADAHYSGTVDIYIAGKALDAITTGSQIDRKSTVPVKIVVKPGPVFVLGKVRVSDETGRLYDPAEFGLVDGERAGSGAVSVAEIKLVDFLNEEGRPYAKVSEREAIADHDRHSLDIDLKLAAGPIAPFGETRVAGTEAVDSDFTAYMAGIRRGKTYSPEDIKQAQERLQSLGVFESITVRPASEPDANGAVPVEISAAERKHRYFGIGATLSNTDGAGIEGYWGHRNLFGRAEKLRLEGSVSRIGEANSFSKLNYNAALLFEKPGVLGPPSKFTASIKASSENDPAYQQRTAQAAAGVTYDLNRHQSGSVGVALDYSRLTTSLGTKDYLTASVPIEYVFDYRDDKLNPGAGYRAVLGVAPSYEFLSKAIYAKFHGELSAYRSLDESKRFILAGRLALGSIVGAGLSSIPANQRFFAGGGGSVRGYSFQGIGPRDATGAPTGGLSLFEGSVEMRMQVTEKVGAVAFLDAGSVGLKSVPDFSSIKVGAGLGLRYLTPFGPLRFDVGIPLNRSTGDPAYGLYAGIGQAY